MSRCGQVQVGLYILCVSKCVKSVAFDGLGSVSANRFSLQVSYFHAFCRFPYLAEVRIVVRMPLNSDWSACSNPQFATSVSYGWSGVV